MNLVLIGFMGTGKTAVGRRLARRLGWRFVDVDALIERGTGCSIPRLFAQRGEPVFRRLERRWIGRVIRGRRQVIATGGGAFLDPANRSLLKASGPVIGLTARPRAILARIGGRTPWSGWPRPPRRRFPGWAGWGCPSSSDSAA